jgi:dienelactone hydrolase
MQLGNPARWFALVGFGLALLLFAPPLVARAAAPKEEKGKRVTFRSVDGVELSGTFYARPAPKEKACVILLHDFTKKNGGDSHADDMDKLAEDLQADGYDVLSFDFRGHGDSKNVTDVFWTFPHNRLVAPQGFNPKSPPSSIDQKSFPASYYPHLVDDVSAAKLYLDRKKEVNSANVVVVGCGQGAGIGMAWMFSQYRLHRQKGVKPNRAPDFDDPEGKDIVSGIWLTPTSQVEGIGVPYKEYLDELELTHKVPMLFIYGDQDDAAKTRTLAWLQGVMPKYELLGDGKGDKHPEKKLKLTRDWAIKETKLASSKLLSADLPTNKTIKQYIDTCVDERPGGLHDRRNVEVDKFPYFWVNPHTGASVPAKAMSEENLKPISLSVIYMGR